MNLQHIHCLLFDLDDTLYPQNNGAWDMIRKRINHFMIEELHFPPEDVPQLRHRLWQQYGTTLRGLQTEYTVDMDSFLDYVHDVPLEEVLQPNPPLVSLLQSLPQRKVVFTNANANHANHVLGLLGVTHLFESIIDIYAIAPHCKPEIAAFKKALNLINEDPINCLLFDDSPGNLATASALGIATVSVGDRWHDGSPHIESILRLNSLFNM
ncbi:MAG: pyrimidine 5'-nucleotidase [Chloroflexota bacterium]|nr:pyrimidine 5'-nucleotidase [Chloroflexota bacterium]